MWFFKEPNQVKSLISENITYLREKNEWNIACTVSYHENWLKINNIKNYIFPTKTNFKDNTCWISNTCSMEKAL